MNMKLTTLLPWAALALSGAAMPAAAQQKLLPAQSDMAFVFKQMGVPVEGRFKKFDAKINFDAAKPAASLVAFTVDIASATLGAPETDAELPKADWFNTAKFPQAMFASSGFKALGGGKYEVTGKLTIKGLVFKIGENDWADTSMVANDVQVKFKLALNGVGKF
jgi:polyisoprenoid-binding protein YceI